MDPCSKICSSVQTWYLKKFPFFISALSLSFPWFWNLRLLHHKGRICLHDHGTIGGIKTILVFLSAGSRLETNQYFIHPHTLQQLLRAPEPWIFGSSFWTSLFSRLTCGTHSVYSKINFSPFLLRLFVHSSWSGRHFPFSQKTTRAKHELCRAVQWAEGKASPWDGTRWSIGPSSAGSEVWQGARLCLPLVTTLPVIASFSLHGDVVGGDILWKWKGGSCYQTTLAHISNVMHCNAAKQSWKKKNKNKFLLKCLFLEQFHSFCSCGQRHGAWSQGESRLGAEGLI